MAIRRMCFRIFLWGKMTLDVCWLCEAPFFLRDKEGGSWKT